MQIVMWSHSSENLQLH